ncbi:MAG TPA: Ig-like domain-containing protein [Chryseosolibacter sp.]|nr:Ig-like domain-containing protein [Chryseosolibacter sp.]
MQTLFESPKPAVTRVLALGIVLAMLVTGCDMLEDDFEETDDQVALIDQEVYVTPASSGVIDLKSLVQSGAAVRLQVASQPSFGTLQSIGEDLLQYVPDPGVQAGEDAFRVGIYNNSDIFLREDTVIIIISPDSVNIPCGLHALTDYVYDVDGPTYIAVLANDTACGIDMSQLELTIPATEVNGHPVPEYGTVQVSNHAVVYTPGPNFTGTDHFYYRVRKPADVPNAGDPEVISHGVVYISVSTSCPPDSAVAFDDYYRFSADSMTTIDTVRLNVTGNDHIVRPDCSENDIVLSVQTPPQGTVIQRELAFDYTFPPNATTGFQDSLVYKICVGSTCDTAQVIIKLE